MQKKREDLRIIIPAAGSGTRGYPATTAFSKELIPLPFDSFLQNSIVILVEKLVQAGINPKNIAIVISPEKTSIKSVFESKKLIIEGLKSKGKIILLKKLNELNF